MAYIGIQPAEKFTSFATQEFSTSATTSYTLDHAVANENEIALFVNNVRQQPGSGKAYTATGTALTLSAATASTDTMYCVFLGRALQTVTPATNSITAAMIGNDLISGKDALASEPADTDEFLVSDAGTLKRIDYSLIKGGGITVANQWRYTGGASLSATTEVFITSDIEEVTTTDTAGQGKIGNSMSVSSGVFTFPSTGVYLVGFNSNFYVSSGANSSRYIYSKISVTTDNSSYTPIAEAYTSINHVTSATYGSNAVQSLIDVTDTSNVKVKFSLKSIEDATLQGGSSENRTYFTFIRLGDT